MSSASLWVKLGLVDKDFDNGLKAAENKLNRFGNRINGLGSKMTQAFTVPLGMAGAAAIKMGADMEVAEVAFTTLLGSADKARKHLEDLKKFAAETPFQFTELTMASRRMMALGFSAESVVPVLRVLGDAVSALGIGSDGLERIIFSLGQMRAKGVASAEEMRELAKAGIPAWKMLADAIGVSVPKAMKMAEDKAVDSGTAIKAILEGLANDPKFAGGMEKQMKTLQGIFSNFLDTVGFTLADIGTLIIETFDIKNKLTGFTEWLRGFAAWFKSLSPVARGALVNIALFTAALGPLLIIVGKVSTGISALVGVMRLLPVGMLTTTITNYVTALQGVATGSAAAASGITFMNAAILQAIATTSAYLAVLGAVVMLYKGIKSIPSNFGTQKNLKDYIGGDLNKAYEQLAALTEERDRLMKTIDKGKKGGMFGIGKMSEDELTNYTTRLGNIQNKIKLVQQIISKITGASGKGLDTSGLMAQLKEVFKDMPKFNPDDMKKGFDLSGFLEDTQKELDGATESASLFGTGEELGAQKADILRNAIVRLLNEGYKPTDEAVSNLIDQYQQYATAIIDVSNAEEAYNGQEGVDAYYASLAENQAKAEQAVTDGNERLKESLGEVVPEWQKFADQLRVFASAEGVADETKKKLNELATSIEDANWGTQANVGGGWENPAFADLKPENMAVVEAAHEYLMQIADEETPAWESLAEQLEATAEKCPAISENLYELAAKVREAGQAADETGQSLRDMTVGDALAKSYEDYESSFSTLSEDMYDFGTNTLGTVRDGFEGLFDSAGHGFKNLGDVLEDFFGSLWRNLVKLEANNMMRALMSNTSLGSLFGGLLGGGTSGTSEGYSGTYDGTTGYTPGNWGQTTASKTLDKVSAFSGSRPGTFISKSEGISNRQAPNVQFHLINQSGIPLQAEHKSTQYDAEGAILGVVIKAYADNKSGFRDMLGRR